MCLMSVKIEGPTSDNLIKAAVSKPPNGLALFSIFGAKKAFLFLSSAKCVATGADA